MIAVRILGMCFVAIAAGCGGAIKEAPPGALTPLTIDPSLAGPKSAVVPVEPPRTEAKGEAIVAMAPPPTIAPAPPASPPQPAMVGDKPTGIKPLAATQATTPKPTASSQSAAKAAPPPAKALAKVSADPPAVEPLRKNADPPPAAGKPEPPPLDVAALTARLRDTPAIGVFTKLALKNQMDDLLNRFRAHYQSQPKASVAPLRQPFDMLVLKVLAVVQDNDPPLARMISASREAIWGILADREKFASLT